MKHTKPFILAFFILLLQSQLGLSQIYFGGGMRYHTSTEFKAIGIQGKIGIPMSDKFDFNGNVGYYLASKATFTFDFDAHYLLFNIDDKMIINPFGGINFTHTTVTNNSLSLGLSLKFPTDRFTYFVEPRWIFDNSPFILTVGVIL